MMADIASLKSVKEVIRRSLDEDLSPQRLDATSEALIDPKTVATGEIYAKAASCIVAGAGVAKAVFKAIDPKLQVHILKKDGSLARPKEPILVFKGKARSILAAERTALNFMQRMCATATLTHKFVAATRRYHTLILDTRKTTPALRIFEKYAVKCGGGANHRFGMYDRILIKDNHRRLWCGGDPDRLDEAVRVARKRFPKLMVEVEVESVRECISALRASPEWIMLDNMSIKDMKACVKLCQGRALTEASGGITLKRARQVAATKVSAISLGCLTHSAPAVDLSLEWRAI